MVSVRRLSLLSGLVAGLCAGVVHADDVVLPPAALGATPAAAFASHSARMSAIARHFAETHPLSTVPAAATEDNTVALIAHLQAATDDDKFAAAPGLEPSRTLAITMLRRLNQGHGQVGTSYDEGFPIGSRKGDYDMALKGLMVVAYRYPNIVSREDVDFILNSLVPSHLRGRHDESRETYPILTEHAPETENHLLMMESTRYLVNQLLFDRTKDPTFDNNGNRLTEWLLNYLNPIAKHDFMEFNARPYNRLSLHALLNLNEFARDEPIRTAARNILDYLMVKFAVSSDRQRRLAPFRRLREHLNTPSHLNDFAHEGIGNDPVIGYFTAFTGFMGADDKPQDRYPANWEFEAVLSGLASYRPPPAAYILAMRNDLPAHQHRFFHGQRPQPNGSRDKPDGGVEIYYRSQSFLLTAGGMFLNSGYGLDELTKYKQVGAAQSTTLMPTRSDLNFSDLIRFDPYPDFRRATNTGVDRGFACGANFRPAEKSRLADSSPFGPTMSVYDNRLLFGWTGVGDQQLNVATVVTTTSMLDGVEGLVNKVTLADKSDGAVAFATHAGKLYAAWRGSGNKTLNLMVSGDGGATWRGKTTLKDSSDHAPALVSHGNALLLAWTGLGEGKLNVARVVLIGNTRGDFDIEGINGKVTLADSSDSGPALASAGGRVLLGWRGTGDGNLNLIASTDGASWGSKTTFADTSHLAPALAVHNNALFIGWTGTGAGQLNVARVPLIGNTAGGFSIGKLEGKVSLGETSDAAPALASFNGFLLIGWKGSGNENLNLRISRDGSFPPLARWVFSDQSKLGFYVAAYRTSPAHPDQLDTPLDSLGMLYAMEAGSLSFDQFRTRIMAANTNLPAQLEYGGRYSFSTPDGLRFGCWLHPSLDKYKSRAALQDVPGTIDDLSTLPLAEGPYLRTPGGHDGLVEIRTPGCENAPLVLDSSNAALPRRQDNRATCPGPWVDRAQALAGVAKTLTAAGSLRLRQAALRDAVSVYRDLAAGNAVRYAPDVAASTVEALASVGVDYSVPPAQLAEWLNNAAYTPYPALSDALLAQLQGHKFRRPVYLDVIAWNYENAPGAKSPRNASEVDAVRLKAAALEGYNKRYDERRVSFDAIVE